MISKWVNKKFYLENSRINFINYEYIYYQVKWHDIIEEGFNVKTKYICTEDEYGKIICLMPVFLKKKSFFKII